MRIYSRRWGRRAGSVLFAGLLLTGLDKVEASGGTGSDQSLVAYAVHIDRTPTQPWPGYGVYLGNGYVLTAAHVVGKASVTDPRVVIDGKILDSRVVREGTFEGDDLTLLRVDESQLSQNLRQLHVTVCSQEPPLGASVVVSTPEGVALSHLVRPTALSDSLLAHYPTLIGDVASTGNSGSGVFDQKTHCLLGIMSRKITLQKTILDDHDRKERQYIDIAKYFVPFDKIKAALPREVRY